MTEGGFDHIFFQYSLSTLCLKRISFVNASSKVCFTSLFTVFSLYFPGFFWKCLYINCFFHGAGIMVSFCLAERWSHLSVEIDVSWFSLLWCVSSHYIYFPECLRNRENSTHNLAGEYLICNLWSSVQYILLCRDLLSLKRFLYFHETTMLIWCIVYLVFFKWRKNLSC